MEAGGTTIDCATNDGGDPKSTRWPRGRVVVDNVYATYQYPAEMRFPHPILFNSGGGHSARVYDTTPDGREGWLTLFVRQGFAVYGVDRPNTGRSGTDICKINAVQARPGAAVDDAGDQSICRRIVVGDIPLGTEIRRAVSRTRSSRSRRPTTIIRRQSAPTAIRRRREKSVAAFSALIDKVPEPVIIQTWSSSGLLGYLTAAERADRVKAILAIETSTSAFDNIPAAARQKLAKIPILIVIGDRAEDRVEASRKFQKEMAAIGGSVTVDVLPEAGIYGNGHTLMIEKNNKQIMHRMIAWLEGVVYRPK